MFSSTEVFHQSRATFVRPHTEISNWKLLQWFTRTLISAVIAHHVLCSFEVGRVNFFLLLAFVPKVKARNDGFHGERCFILLSLYLNRDTA